MSEESTSEETHITTDDNLLDLDPIGDTKVAPATGIAAIALNMAMKYYDISTVQDGTLYQQYKVEGRNLQPISINAVFETAIQIEAHLLGASERIAKLVVDAIEFGVDEDADEDLATSPDITS